MSSAPLQNIGRKQIRKVDVLLQRFSSVERISNMRQDIEGDLETGGLPN
jgi:hypothetical protein